jgi:hypothetical protein
MQAQNKLPPSTLGVDPAQPMATADQTLMERAFRKRNWISQLVGRRDARGSGQREAESGGLIGGSRRSWETRSISGM